MQSIRVRSGKFWRREIPAKWVFCRNMILCEKTRCSGTETAAWKRFLGRDNASQREILLRPSFSSRLRDCDSACYSCVTCVMHQQKCTWVMSLTCVNNVNDISIHSSCVISRGVDMGVRLYCFIAQRFHYRMTIAFYGTKGPLCHPILHNTVLLFVHSNAWLQRFAIAFQLLLKIARALL